MRILFHDIFLNQNDRTVFVPFCFSLSVTLIYFTENFMSIIHACERSLSSQKVFEYQFLLSSWFLVFSFGMVFLYFVTFPHNEIKDNIFSIICFDLRVCAFQVPIIPFQNIFLLQFQSVMFSWLLFYSTGFDEIKIMETSIQYMST